MAEQPQSWSGRRRRLALRLLAVGFTVVILGAASYVALAPRPPSPVSTTSTQFSVSASDVISSAAAQDPSGYTLESSRGNAAATAAWAVLGAADGSAANMTALVFGSANQSQSYYTRLVAGIRGLPGYTDVTSVLSRYQQYGRCYGYGEDVDGIGVADGVCTVGNVFLHVHLVSSKPFSDLQLDLGNLMGALYQSVD